MDGRSQIQVHTDERTQVHSAQTSLATIYIAHPSDSIVIRTYCSTDASCDKYSHGIFCNLWPHTTSLSLSRGWEIRQRMKHKHFAVLIRNDRLDKRRVRKPFTWDVIQQCLFAYTLDGPRRRCNIHDCIWADRYRDENNCKIIQHPLPDRVIHDSSTSYFPTVRNGESISLLQCWDHVIDLSGEIYGDGVSTTAICNLVEDNGASVPIHSLSILATMSRCNICRKTSLPATRRISDVSQFSLHRANCARRVRSRTLSINRSERECFNSPDLTHSLTDKDNEKSHSRATFRILSKRMRVILLILPSMTAVPTTPGNDTIRCLAPFHTIH